MTARKHTRSFSAFGVEDYWRLQLWRGSAVKLFRSSQSTRFRQSDANTSLLADLHRKGLFANFQMMGRKSRYHQGHRDRICRCTVTNKLSSWPRRTTQLSLPALKLWKYYSRNQQTATGPCHISAMAKRTKYQYWTLRSYTRSRHQDCVWRKPFDWE
jgi:hypothetical protein